MEGEEAEELFALDATGTLPVKPFKWLANVSRMIVTQVQIDVHLAQQELSQRETKVVFPEEDDTFTIQEIISCMNATKQLRFHDYMIIEFVFVLYNIKVVDYRYDDFLLEAVETQKLRDRAPHPPYVIEWQTILFGTPVPYSWLPSIPEEPEE